MEKTNIENFEKLPWKIMQLSQQLQGLNEGRTTAFELFLQSSLKLGQGLSKVSS